MAYLLYATKDETIAAPTITFIGKKKGGQYLGIIPLKLNKLSL